ncbi:MAG: hypothetical protein U5R30_11730 [Deltaproteobacteria bacterium]|nr:hypothetical protein [Deltaproteobacteria bacterium]
MTRPARTGDKKHHPIDRVTGAIGVPGDARRSSRNCCGTCS